MTTHQIGPFTLEEFKPREWRAWKDGRPAPLPSLEELVEACWSHSAVAYLHPVNWEGTNSEDICEEWLRTLLPGYEEQCSKADSPVWRPIETAPKAPASFSSEEFWAVRSNGDVYRVVRNAWGFSVINSSLWCRDWTHWLPGNVEQPLPPPPQEKGGEA